MLRTEPKDPFADVPGAREMTLTIDGATGIGGRQSSLSMKPNSKYQNYSSKDRMENERERLESAPMFTMHPHSTFRIIWDIGTVIILLLNVIFIPYQIAFCTRPEHRRNGITLFALSDIWFLIDILFNFKTGFLKETSIETEVIFDPDEIRCKYLKGWFIVDFISSVPWDICIGLLTAGSSRFFLKILRMVKLLKLMRLSRLTKTLNQWEDVLSFQYGITINGTVVKFCKLISYILVFIHINAVILFLVPAMMDFPGHYEPDDPGFNVFGPSWPFLRNLQHEEPFIQYSWSFFKAASNMMVIGYGRSFPLCLVDMCVVMWSMFSGCLVFAIAIAEITSLIHALNTSSSQYKEKMTEMDEYMNFCKVPIELRNRVRDYYEVRFKGKMFNETDILNELNPLLREKIVNFNCRALIKSVEFLATADPEFVAELISQLQFEVYLPGDEIITEGEKGTHMYFISQGSVQVKTKKTGKPIVLSEGDHFGEICLFAPNLRRTASIVGQHTVHVYTLSSSDFNDALKWYPGEKIEIQKVAIERMDMLLNEMKRNNSAQGRTSLSTEVIADLQKYRNMLQEQNRQARASQAEFIANRKTKNKSSTAKSLLRQMNDNDDINVDVLAELTKPKSQEISKFQFNDGYADRSSTSDDE